MEDYELMHRMIENERSERMVETILSGYLSNLGKYTEGRPAGEWVSFPTTAEHLKEVFDRIGIDGKNYGELHITEYQSSIAGLAGKLTELESLDELNYLSELLKMQFDDDRENLLQLWNTATIQGTCRILSTLHKTLIVTGFTRPYRVRKITGII